VIRRHDIAALAKGEITVNEPVKMTLRLPPDIKRWIDREAERNFSSQSSEVVRSVRSRMESEQEKVG
jgi:hypothetical protein